MVVCSTFEADDAYTAVLFGVPQAWIGGPILFLLYTAYLLQLVETHGLHLHSDDIQIYGLCLS